MRVKANVFVAVEFDAAPASQVPLTIGVYDQSGAAIGTVMVPVDIPESPAAAVPPVVSVPRGPVVEVMQ